MTGHQGSHAERDPELRLDHVLSTRIKAEADAAALRLKEHGFVVSRAVVDHRTRRGRTVLHHDVLVPSAQASAAKEVIASAPFERAPEPSMWDGSSLRTRLGDKGYEGLITASWIVGSMLVLVFLLLVFR